MISSRYLETLVTAVRRAGAIIKRHYLSESLQVTRKSGYGDLVSSADLESEKEVLSILRREFPDASIVSEESGGSRASGTVFYVDPVDGTLNYVHGMPFFAVSIGCWIDGQPAAGAVFNPLTGDLYTASRGEGAKKNGKRLSVSDAGSIKEALATGGWPYEREYTDRLFPQMQRVYAATQEIRALGSASLELCLLAEGACDCYWEWALKPWDWAAGAVIVIEAGGTVTNMAGGELTLDGSDVAASNGKLHKEWIKVLNSSS